MPCKNCEEVKAALGTIRQDIRMILAHLGISGENVDPGASQGPSGVDMERFQAEWKKKVNEAWEKHLASRKAGDEVTPEDEADYQEGWLR